MYGRKNIKHVCLQQAGSCFPCMYGLPIHMGVQQRVVISPSSIQKADTVGNVTYIAKKSEVCGIKPFENILNSFSDRVFQYTKLNGDLTISTKSEKPMLLGRAFNAWLVLKLILK